MHVKTFAEIETEFRRRVARDLCCNLATIDTQGRPRSRVVHPVWEGTIGWLLTDRTSLKARHINHCPFVSLAYIGDTTQTAYVECRAEWVEDMPEKRRVWTLFEQSPLGYNPALFYETVDNPKLGLLKLIPWRVQLDDSPGETTIWENSD